MIKQLQELSSQFLAERPTIQASQLTPIAVALLAWQEFDELHAELSNGADPKEVVSELTDVFNYLAQLMTVLGVSEDEIVKESTYKYTRRNHVKYSPDDDGVVSKQNQVAFWEQNKKYGNPMQPGNDYY